jgi:hypothetical protein
LVKILQCSSYDFTRQAGDTRQWLLYMLRPFQRARICEDWSLGTGDRWRTRNCHKVTIIHMAIWRKLNYFDTVSRYFQIKGLRFRSKNINHTYCELFLGILYRGKWGYVEHGAK